MSNTIIVPDGSLNFETISEFKNCMNRHGEVIFCWNGKEYSITHYCGKISIAESYKQETEMFFTTADEALTYMLDNVSLRDVITQVRVLARTV